MRKERYLEKLTRAFGGAGESPATAAPLQAELGPGEEVATPFGPCLALTSEHPAGLRLPHRSLAEEAVAQAFCLLFGIGPVREGDLRATGARTFADLVPHPRYGSEAQRWLAALASQDLPSLYEGISRRFSASHDLLLHLLAFADPEDLVFLDIESLGLSGLPAFLAGVGRLNGDGLHVRQYLARSLAEEPAILAALREALPPRPVVVSYNGKAHDWNHLQARFAYHGLDPLPEPVHLDLLFFARRRWGGELLDCSLPQVERAVLGMTREVDVPGEYVPICYQNYLRTGSAAPLVPVIAHNREDVVTLARLLSLLLERVTGHG
ncbi:MAG: ribonuclease H-like domain-containing protein [Candidatus Bipolaricaulota bacterium]